MKSDQFVFHILIQLLSENSIILVFAILHHQFSHAREGAAAAEKFSVLNSFATRWQLLNFPKAPQKTCKTSAEQLLQADCSGTVHIILSLKLHKD